MIVEPKGRSTLKITWKAPPSDLWNGDLHGFYIAYKLQGSSQPFSLQTVKAAANNANALHKYEYFLRNLMHGTAYIVAVKAYNGAGSGPLSPEIRAQTFDGELPESPELTISTSTKTSLSLHWTQPKSIERTNIISYTIHYKRENQDWRQIAVPTSLSSTVSPPDDPSMLQLLGNSYTLTNLESGTKYTIFITGVNSFGIGDPSNIVTTSTNGGKRLDNSNNSFHELLSNEL